jgi:L-malate glycosyltransferase
MKPPVRVGFIVHVMQVAGAEVLVRETIARLGSRIIPTVFCLDRVGSIGEELQAQGVEVVCFDRKPGWDFTVSWRMAKEIRRRKITVLHAHQYTPFFYTALAKVLVWPWPKLILTEHGRHYPDLVSPPRRAINRLFLDPLADEVNACIGFSARALGRIDGFRGNRIGVIENGIDVENYGLGTPAAARDVVGLPHDRRHIIHVARHHPVKDQATLLKGFASVASQLPDVDLVMVGDGPLRTELEDLTRTLGIADRVKFLGIRKDVATVLRACDVFALTSVSEAASLTLLEAMASGLPVVVSDVGGNPDIVRRGTDGLLFPRGDAAACGKCFVELLGDPVKLQQMGANARTRTVERYQLKNTIEAYARLYGV